MKKLNDLRKQLPSTAKLNCFESNRVKGGADKPAKRGSTGKRPSGNGFGYSSNDGNENGDC